MSLRDEMLSDNTQLIENAVVICRGYLNGPWKKITSKDVTVKRVSGGLSNWLYQVTLEKYAGQAPKQVLLRLYGQTHGEGAFESLITESVIFTLLSERKLGPKLYGIFPGGRIEEYIPARPLKMSEMTDPQMNLLVADKMAAIHTMNVPISKEPRWLWDTMDRWLSNIEETKYNDENANISDDKISSKTLRQELTWLKSHLTKLNSPVVFCHNDLQEGNILLREDAKDPSLVIIDFEYCSYNYRGFDLANHFIEWTYDYTNPEYPHFAVTRDNYSSPNQMRNFVERYLKGIGSSGSQTKPEMNKPEIVMNEILHFTLASHLFWGLWSLVNSNVSQISFGYTEYADERLSSYFALKEKLLTTSKEPVTAKKKQTHD